MPAKAKSPKEPDHYDKPIFAYPPASPSEAEFALHKEQRLANEREFGPEIREWFAVMGEDALKTGLVDPYFRSWQGKPSLVLKYWAAAHWDEVLPRILEELKANGAMGDMPAMNYFSGLIRKQLAARKGRATRKAKGA